MFGLFKPKPKTESFDIRQGLPRRKRRYVGITEGPAKGGQNLPPVSHRPPPPQGQDGQAQSAEKSEPIKKSIKDFADLAVPRQSGTPAPAQWTVNRDEFVRHYTNTVHIAVGAVARKIAMQEAKVSVRRVEKSGVKLEPVKDTHPLVELFREVNPRDTEYDLWFLTVAWRLLTGDAFWWMPKNSFGVPAELWPLPSQWVWAIPSETEFIGSYLVRGVFGKDTEIPAADIWHLREPSVDWSGSGRFYGRPTLGAVAQMVDIEDAMQKRLWHQFKNFSPPSLHYSANEKTDINPDELGDILQWYATQHASSEHSGRPIVDYPGFTVTEFRNSVREMDYGKSLEVAMDTILATYGVPKAVVGLVKDSNRANMESAMLTFAENTINPMLVHLGQHLTQGLAREFDENLVVHFDPMTVDDAEATRKAIETASRAGALAPNEIREELFSKGPYKFGGDLPIVQGTMTEAQFGNEKPKPPPEPKGQQQPQQPGSQRPKVPPQPGSRFGPKDVDKAVDAAMDVDDNGLITATGFEVPERFFRPGQGNGQAATDTVARTS